jgi:purine-binding chemotaxis protein CheW
MTDPENIGAANDAATNGRRCLGFRAADVLFAADIMAVREITRSASLTSIPNSPPCVKGLMMLHGKIFPLIDFRRKMFPSLEAPEKENPWIIVLEIRRALNGIMADSVAGFITLPAKEAMEGEVPRLQGIDPRFIAETRGSENALVVIPDYDRIFFGFEE